MERPLAQGRRRSCCTATCSTRSRASPSGISRSAASRLRQQHAEHVPAGVRPGSNGDVDVEHEPVGRSTSTTASTSAPRWTIDAGLRYDYEKPRRVRRQRLSAASGVPLADQERHEQHRPAPRLRVRRLRQRPFGSPRRHRQVLQLHAGHPAGQADSGHQRRARTSTFTCTTTATNPCPTIRTSLRPTSSWRSRASARTSSRSVLNYQAQEAWRSSLQFEQQLGNVVQRRRRRRLLETDARAGNEEHQRRPDRRRPRQHAGLRLQQLRHPNRPYNDIGIIREITSNEDAWYRAQTLEFHKLAVNNSNLSWDLSYTHSTSIDKETNTRSTSTTFLIDPNNPNLSEGPSDNDVKHRIVGDLTYRLPFGFRSPPSASGTAASRTPGDRLHLRRLHGEQPHRPAADQRRGQLHAGVHRLQRQDHRPHPGERIDPAAVRDVPSARTVT